MGGRGQYFTLKAAQFVGQLSGVESKLDTYHDYYLTSAELVNPANVDSEQLKLLQSDPHFKDQKNYLVSGVQEQPSGDLKQRRFILNANDMHKMGIPEPKEGQIIGGQNKVMIDKKFTFETLGQYLEEMDLGVGKINIAKIYPRVQDGSTEAAAAPDVKRVNEALSKNKVGSGLDLHFESRPKPVVKRPFGGLTP